MAWCDNENISGLFSLAGGLQKKSNKQANKQTNEQTNKHVPTKRGFVT